MHKILSLASSANPLSIPFTSSFDRSIRRLSLHPSSQFLFSPRTPLSLHPILFRRSHHSFSPSRHQHASGNAGACNTFCDMRAPSTVSDYRLSFLSPSLNTSPLHSNNLVNIWVPSNKTPVRPCSRIGRSNSSRQASTFFKYTSSTASSTIEEKGGKHNSNCGGGI